MALQRSARRRSGRTCALLEHAAQQVGDRVVGRGGDEGLDFLRRRPRAARWCTSSPASSTAVVDPARGDAAGLFVELLGLGRRLPSRTAMRPARCCAAAKPGHASATSSAGEVCLSDSLVTRASRYAASGGGLLDQPEGLHVGGGLRQLGGVLRARRQAAGGIGSFRWNRPRRAVAKGSTGGAQAPPGALTSKTPAPTTTTSSARTSPRITGRASRRGRRRRLSDAAGAARAPPGHFFSAYQVRIATMELRLATTSSEADLHGRVVEAAGVIVRGQVAPRLHGAHVREHVGGNDARRWPAGGTW